MSLRRDIALMDDPLPFCFTNNFKRMSHVLRETHLSWPPLTVIMGEKGIGKTTCARKYWQDNVNTCTYIKISETTSEKDFASMLSEAVHMEFTGMNDWETKWLRHIALFSHRKPLFIIDDFSFKRPLINLMNSLLSDSKSNCAFVLIDSNPMSGRGGLGLKNSLYLKGHYRIIELLPLQKSDLHDLWKKVMEIWPDWKLEYEDFMKARSFHEINRL